MFEVPSGVRVVRRATTLARGEGDAYAGAAFATGAHQLVVAFPNRNVPVCDTDAG